MTLMEAAVWLGERDGVLGALRTAYFAMTPVDVPHELRRLVARLDEPSPHPSSDTLALVAQADPDGRALASALLSETEFDVIECASAEAALAVLVREAGRTSFLLADCELAGERNAESLTSSVRMLWPGVHVALASLGSDEQSRVDADGIVRLSRPWRGLDVLIEAERALAKAA